MNTIRAIISQKGLFQVKLRLNKRRLIIFAITIYVSITLVQQQYTIIRLHREQRDLSKKIEIAKKENERLQKEIEYSKTLDFVKKIASDELGLIKKGQTVYVDINRK